MKSILRIALGWAVLVPAFAQLGQLYLIAGSTTPKYEIGYSTQVVAVGTDGSVNPIQEIVSRRFGAEWITVSYDHRKAVILSKAPDDRAIVFDFETASVVKSCQQHPPRGFVLVYPRLIDSPSRGLLFVEDLGAVDKQKDHDQLLGMTVDPTVPCQNSFMQLDNSEMKYVIAHGGAGVADTGGGDGVDVFLKTDGSFGTRRLTGEETYFDYRVPPNLFNDMKDPITQLVLNNQQILGLAATQVAVRNGFVAMPPKVEKSRLLFLRKNDQTWHQDAEASVVRAFGTFIVASESHPKGGAVTESAGKADWRQEDSPTGPSIAFRLNDYPDVYPGILHLYDASTDRKFTITTNQGDSEILLVESRTVYYRVGNRLYSAPISVTSIGPAKLLATDELIRDAHWAFLKH